MRIAALLLGLSIMLSSTRAQEPVAPLQVGPEATILRNGKPYRAVGANYFDCFLRTLKKPDERAYEAGFAALREQKIPFVRFCATGFWPKDMDLYRRDRDDYFRRLDGVVRCAESNGIGLVPSLFWHFSCVPDLCGEPMDQWANPESRTRAFMRDYVREVVTRYRTSPAIWMWELGNEYSLQACLPNAKEHRPPVHPTLGTATNRTERDDLTFAQVRHVFAAFAEEVRRHDPKRPLATGDSFPRLSAWHQEQENSWKQDSREQFLEMLERANPAPVSAISLHAYEDDDQRLGWAAEVARKTGQPLFVGEFGAQGTSDAQAAKFRRLLRALDEHRVPLAAVWVFDLKQQADFTITATNDRAWQLREISEHNARIATGAAAP